MRTFASVGTCSFIAGLFFFTRGLAGHPTSLIFGAVLGLLGLIIFGLVASHPDSATDFRPRVKRRQRRRSAAGMRSLRTRSQLGAAGGR